MAGEKTESKKSRGLGCLPRLIIFLLIIVIAGYVAVRVFFPADKVKAEIIKRVSESLGRPVELDAVSLGLLPTPSLDLKGLRIYNPEDFPGAEFVAVDHLSFGLKIMPLFRKQFVFSEITIDHPVVQLRKTADGRTNYSFEVDVGEEGIATPLGKKEAVTSEEAALTAFAFDWAEISHADIVYVDDSANTKTVLNNVSLETRLHLEADGKSGRSIGTLKIPAVSSTLIPENIPLDISVAYNADIDFVHADLVFKDTRVEISGIPFEVEATVRKFTDPQSVFAKIQADGVSLEPLVKYIPASDNLNPELLRISGKISGNAEARMEFGTERTPYLSGAFDFTDLGLGYQTVAARVHFDRLHVDFTADSVSFVSEGGELSGQSLTLAGAVKNWDDIRYNIRAAGVYDLSGIMPFLDPEYNHQIKGMARFDIKAGGQKSQWLHTDVLGTISADGVYYKNDSLTSALERLDAKITFAKNQTKIESLYAEYPGVKLTLTGEIKNGFAHLIKPRDGYKKPYLDFNMHAPLVNYDILVPEEEAAAVSQAAPAGPGETVEMTAPFFLPDIEAAGRVVVDTFVFQEIRLTDVTGDMRYNEGILKFTNTTGKIYSGVVAAEGMVDITDIYQPAVNCSFSGSNIEADGFLTQFANAGGHLFGKINVSGTMQGKGAEITDFVNTLDADGDLNMKEGRLVNFELINNVAAKLGFKTFKEESLKDLVSKVKIRQGNLVLDGTKVISSMGDWDVNGGVAFIEKSLDLDVGLYLAEKYAKDVDLLGGLLQDDKGRVKINFKLGGSYNNPKISNISTDNSVVKDKAEDMLKKGVDKLKDLFKKD